MSNPNNLIRPPILNAPIPPNPNNAINIPGLSELITNIVNNTIRNTNSDLVGTDQIINPEHRNNLGELDKIPDIVRSIREFSGKQEEFNSWRKSVERILKIYEQSIGTPKYYGILSVIRNKIIGEADAVLESYNTPLNWKSISKCLTLHYADKRDIPTLEYQMTTLVQGHHTVQDYYQMVYKNLSLILNKIGCMELSNDATNLLTQTYRDKALDTFVRGLRGDLPRLLAMREPVDLPQALHLCLKLENQSFRTNHACNNQNFTKRFQNQPPPVPQRKFTPQPFQKPTVFYPQLAHMPQPITNAFRNYSFQKPPYFNQTDNNNYNPQFAPPRPFGPKPQQKPTPMDIDQTMQTKRVNYMNRPPPNQAFQGKRPPITQPQTQEKRQRNFNIETEQYEDFSPESEPTLPEYLDSIRNYNITEDDFPSDFNNQFKNMDLTDIHFLE